MSAHMPRSGRRLTLALAALAGASSAALSASAGWFLASAALIGAMGPLAAHAFNFLAPSAAVRFFALVRTLARYGERVVGHDEVLSESARMRPRIFLALARDRSRQGRLDAAGETASRLIRDVETAESTLVQERAPLAAAIGAGLAALIAAIFAGVAAACIVLAGFVAATWGAQWLGDRLAKQAAGDVVAQRARLRALSVAAEAGAVELRTLRAGSHMTRLIDASACDLAASEIRVARAGAFVSAFAGAAWLVALFLILLTAQSGHTDWPALVAAVLASLALAEQSLPLAEAATRRTERARSRERVAALLGRGAPQMATHSPQPPWDIAVSSFAALGDNQQPLRPALSFSVAPGEIAVLSGRSGAGKSTLLKALLGQSPPMQGAVAIGGLVPAARADISQLIAYAPQSIDLLPGYVRTNLGLAAPSASEEEMWAALRLAHVADVVERAGGLGAVIDQSGGGFSGGESRRLALARAFVSKRPVLLLDEPTEGLDSVAEAAIAAAIGAYVRAASDRLALIVTHREGLKVMAHKLIDLDLGA